MVTLDLGTGQPVAIGYLDEKDPDKVRRWLEPLVKRLGVSVIVSDDLGTYWTVRCYMNRTGMEASLILAGSGTF